MQSPELATDLQYVGSDVPFYEMEANKKESTYCELLPLPSSQQSQYSVQPSAAILDYFFTSNLSSEDHWDSMTSWQSKPPQQWGHAEVLDWLFCWSKQTGVDLLDVNMREFNHMNGQDLCRLSQSEFYAIDPQYGNSLFQSLSNEITQHCTQHYEPSPISLDIPSPLRTENPLPAFHTWSNDTYSQLFNVVGSNIQGSSPSSSHDSDREDRESTSSSMSTANEKPSPTTAFLATPLIAEDKKGGRRGRPPKGECRTSRSRQGKGNGKLWEFIRDLLLDPTTNPSLIRWERAEDGIFKFVQSDRVAKMWGDRKQNPRMTYEKLSRAMRTYYSSGILSPVPKTDGLPKKLIYKFGPQSSGWH